jgi:alginate O-acetyltransferase complex protein AlgI
MIFLTYWFTIFAALFLPVYWLLPRPLPRKLALLVGCAVFHTHFAGPSGVIPIIVIGMFTWLAGLSRRRWACLTMIVVSTLALVFYKYSIFLSQQVLSIISADLGAWSLAAARHVLPAAPPLAISFFAFEFVHYLYDVSKGQEPIPSLLKFWLFAIFWPSIVSGPVKRYQQFLPALEEGAAGVGLHNISAGIVRVAGGLVKKFAADSIAVYLSVKVPDFAVLSTSLRWVIFVLIGFRILLDFSGYSDMAIGYARLLGVKLPENFDWPYLARSITEFWQRWHISLSTWIRDYIYIPLGGNRHGPARRALNALIAFGLCGLWHGAGWNFLTWGLYHGVGFGINAAYHSLSIRPGGVLLRRLSSPPVAWVMTMFFVGVGWLFFFYPVSQALIMLRLLFTWRA